MAYGSSTACLGECAGSLGTVIQFEGAVAPGLGLHLFDAGPRSAIQRLCNPI